MLDVDELTHHNLTGIARIMLGAKLGGGMSRQVYDCAIGEHIVVKVEADEGHFQNVIEWETWQSLKDTAHARWLAPCHFISPCGGVLIMSKVEPLTPKAERILMPEW